MSAKATSGMPCIAAFTPARVARIFHRTAAIRVFTSGDSDTIESAARATSPAIS